MTEVNINIVLANAVCCSAKKAVEVSKLFSIGDKCAYKEALRLKMLNHYIEAVRCYAQPYPSDSYTTITNGSALIEPVEGDLFDIVESTTYDLYAGDTILSTHTIVSSGLSLITIEALLGKAGLVFYNVSQGPIDFILLSDNITCDMIDLRIVRDDDTVFLFTIDPMPVCEVILTTPSNCLTEEELDILLDRIMKSCDICDCELT